MADSAEKKAEKFHLIPQTHMLHASYAQSLTHIVEQSLLGVFSILLVQSFLENAHSRRHQQGERQHGDT